MFCFSMSGMDTAGASIRKTRLSNLSTVSTKGALRYRPGLLVTLWGLPNRVMITCSVMSTTYKDWVITIRATKASPPRTANIFISGLLRLFS